MADRRIRKDRRRKAERVLADTSSAVLAAAAFGSSLRHVQQIAAENGQPGWISWVIAVSVEIVSLVAILELSRARATGQRVPPAAVLALTAGLAMSAAANGATASGSGAWPIVMALWPVVAYVLVVLIVETRPGRSLEALAERVTERAPAPQPQPETPKPVTIEVTPQPAGSDERPSRDEVLTDLRDRMRTPGWVPDYPALMASTGYGRSWCEKVVRDARAQPARLEAVR